MRVDHYPGSNQGWKVLSQIAIPTFSKKQLLDVPGPVRMRPDSHGCIPSRSASVIRGHSSFALQHFHRCLSLPSLSFRTNNQGLVNCIHIAAKGQPSTCCRSKLVARSHRYASSFVLLEELRIIRLSNTLAPSLPFNHNNSKYLLLRRRLYPRRHLILLIICSREPSMIRLSPLVIKQEADRELGSKLSRLLDLLDFFLGELDCYRVGHCFDVSDGVYADDREDVG